MSVTLHSSQSAAHFSWLTESFSHDSWCLRGATEGAGQSVVEIEDQDQEESEERRVLICQLCSYTITSEKQRIVMNGSHRHTFFNPSGIVYELGCFDKATGVAMVGESSSEFSWFSGYVWRVALCSRCGTHLGWQFSGTRTFYGLILSNLAGG